MLLDPADRKNEYVADLISFIVGSRGTISPAPDISQLVHSGTSEGASVQSCTACGLPIADEQRGKIQFHVDCYQKKLHVTPSGQDAWETFSGLNDSPLRDHPPETRSANKNQNTSDADPPQIERGVSIQADGCPPVTLIR
jgi:hypothetical protein